MRGLLVISFVLLVLSINIASVSATSDVAYIYKRSYKIDNNFVSVFNELGLEVDKISETTLSTVNFSKYKLIFVGDEIYKYANKIPVMDYPSVISNYDQGDIFGLTDEDGVNKLGASFPLNVMLMNQTLNQVYTKAKDGSLAIVYFYLRDQNKAPGMTSVARIYSPNTLDRKPGDAIAYASSEALMANGINRKGKLCFYGIIKTKYWTPEARQLFIDCVNYVASECSSDLDCTSQDIGDKYCIGNDVYQDIKNFHCQDAGTAKSQCVDNIVSNLIEKCADICSNGQCINVTCMNDSECDDSNLYTEDKCLNPATINSTCQHNPIKCLNNLDCGIDGFVGLPFCSGLNIFRDYITFTCQNQGQVTSFCTNSTQAILNQTCSDACDNGACKTITCTKNSDCGINTLSGDVCSGLNIIKNYLNFSCINPGTFSSSCSNVSGSYLIQQCSQQCSLGQCIQINCTTDLDCDDGNARTVDECAFKGTPSSYCRNTEVNCLEDNDCGFSGSTGNEYCSTDDVFKNFQNSVCNNKGTLNSSCSITISQQFIADCGEDYCTNFSSNYCKINDVYHSRTCYDKGCFLGSCFSNPFQQESLVEECDYGCFNGQCNPQCRVNSDCGNSILILECSGNYLVNITTNPKCINGSCGLDVINNTKLCEFGCANSMCIPGIHDVALVDLTNSFNKIFLEYANGTDILTENPVLSCKDTIKAKVKTENIGNFYENVILTGNIAGNPFSLSAIINLAPGASSERTSLTPYISLNLPAGFYNIIINAIIPIDNNPGDNIATRQIQVICPECTADSDCPDDIIGSNYCSNDDTYQDITEFSCASGKCVNSTHSEKADDCGEDYCDNWQNYCNGGEVWKKRTCYDKGCSAGACFSNPNLEDEFVKNCSLGCTNGTCNNICDDPPAECIKSGDDLICQPNLSDADGTFIDNFGMDYHLNYYGQDLFVYRNQAGSGNILYKFNNINISADEVILSLFYKSTWMNSDSFYPGNPTKDILQVGIINSAWNKNTVTWGSHPLLGDIYSEITIDKSQAALLCSTVYGACSPGTGQFIDFNVTAIYKLWQSGTANNGFYIQSKYGDYAYPPGVAEASGNYFNRNATIIYKDVC